MRRIGWCWLAWLLLAGTGCPEQPPGHDRGHGAEGDHAHGAEVDDAHGAAGDHAHEAEGGHAHDDEGDHAHDDEGDHAHGAAGDQAHAAEGEHVHGVEQGHAPGAAGEHAPVAEHGHGLDAGAAVLPPAVVAGLDVEMGPVAERRSLAALKVPGELRADPDRRALVAAPLAARVLALDALPHASVAAGERLALLEIIDAGVRRLQLEAVELRAERLAARTERDRLRTYLNALADEGPTARQERRRVAADLAVIEARLAAQGQTLAALLTSLRAAGLSRRQRTALKQRGEVATRIRLAAPRLAADAPAEVLARPVRRGQVVAAGDPLYELVALDRLQAVGEAFEPDLPAVRRAARQGLPVGLLFPATGRRVDGLRIRSIEGVLDGAQRLARFFVWLPNETTGERSQDGQRYLDWRHRAGARVQLLVGERAAAERIVLPAAAVVRQAGRAFVFRAAGQGLERLVVRLESIDERHAVLQPGSGLQPGQRVVVRGALLAQRALESLRRGPAAETGHGHAH